MAERDLRSVAFPQLAEAQIEKLAKCAGVSTRTFRDGEALFRVGDRKISFFVVKSGEIEIRDLSDDSPRVVTVHKPGEFTGDVTHLTGNPAVVSGIARGACGVYEITSEGLRLILNGCPDLADIILQAFIARRQLLRAPGNFTGLRVIGSRYSQDTFRVRDFLARNRVLFTWLDLEADPETNQLLQQFGLTTADTPVVICGRMLLLRNPTTRALAEEIGIRRPIEQAIYDLVVVGAGPAGLAAAVYGASEGLKTLVLERTAPGGQAGNSMRIENYLGFPTGITGSELADRAVWQAGKFGASLSIPTPAHSLSFDGLYSFLRLDDDETVAARCLLIATGADYRKLSVKHCEQFEGCGVYYAATPNEAQLCRGTEVIVVGGGNSAGQAAVFLASQARKVHLVVRSDTLYKNMSSYLAQRIERTAAIEIHLSAEVRQMSGDDHLAAIEVGCVKTGKTCTVETPALFCFIGAVPRTEWLPDEIETDSRGFVVTGPSLMQSKRWTAKRPPFLLETSRPGVFAAGDVRAGSVKRVASAVGEGSMAVQFVHEYMKEV